MNIYTLRENMIIAYLKEVMGVVAQSVYVYETTDADIKVEYHENDVCHYETLQMSLVIAWIWSKMK